MQAGLRCTCKSLSKQCCLQCFLLHPLQMCLFGVNLLTLVWQGPWDDASNAMQRCAPYTSAAMCLQCGRAALQAVSDAFARGDLSAANEGKIHLRYVIRILGAIEQKEQPGAISKAVYSCTIVP